MKEYKRWEYCSWTERIERWENVLRVLLRMTPHQRREHFNMGTWAEKTKCGTVGCAAGLCSLDPWFRRRGFMSMFSKHVYDDGGEGFEHTFVHLQPYAFFGQEGHDRIFVDDAFTPHRGSKVHARVVIEVRRFIKELKERATKYDSRTVD